MGDSLLRLFHNAEVSKKSEWNFPRGGGENVTVSLVLGLFSADILIHTCLHHDSRQHAHCSAARWLHLSFVPPPRAAFLQKIQTCTHTYSTHIHTHAGDLPRETLSRREWGMRKEKEVWKCMWVTLSSCLWPTWVFASLFFFISLSFSNDMMWSTSPSLRMWLTRESLGFRCFPSKSQRKGKIVSLSIGFFWPRVVGFNSSHRGKWEAGRLIARHRRRKRAQVWTLGERLFRGRQANLRETHETRAICLFRPCCGLASLNRSAAAAAVVPLAASGSLN